MARLSPDQSTVPPHPKLPNIKKVFTYTCLYLLLFFIKTWIRVIFYWDSFSQLGFLFHWCLGFGILFRPVVRDYLYPEVVKPVVEDDRGDGLDHEAKVDVDSYFSEENMQFPRGYEDDWAENEFLNRYV